MDIAHWNSVCQSFVRLQVQAQDKTKQMPWRQKAELQLPGWGWQKGWHSNSTSDSVTSTLTKTRGGGKGCFCFVLFFIVLVTVHSFKEVKAESQQLNTTHPQPEGNDGWTCPLACFSSDGLLDYSTTQGPFLETGLCTSRVDFLPQLTIKAILKEVS